MELTILGSSSATQANGRFPSSQILSINDAQYLIDCGEGTQFKLNEYGFRKSKIQAIFISHLHGDHFFGLIGLLTSMSMHERSSSLQIICPKGLDEIIDLQLHHSGTVIRFPIEYTFFDDRMSVDIYEDQQVLVQTIPLVHKVTTCGFLFHQKFPKYSIIREKLIEYNIPFEDISKIKEGNDWIAPDGQTIPLSELTVEHNSKKTYAYCSDTCYHEAVIPLIKEVDLLYHESTFEEKDKLRAEATKHSTASDAAMIAKKAQVKNLLIGHFSARYPNLSTIHQEASDIFPNTFLAEEGKTIII